MESLFFHPKVVHIPIALALLMPLISASIWLGWLRKWWPARTWVVGLALQGVLVASGVVAMQSGEQDEERVEAVVPEAALEAHEVAAEQFLWAGGVVALAMVGTLLLANHRAGHAAAAASVLGTLVVLALGYRTGQAGGALVYQHNAASVFAAPAGSAGGAGGTNAGAPLGAKTEDDEMD